MLRLLVETRWAHNTLPCFSSCVQILFLKVADHMQLVEGCTFAEAFHQIGTLFERQCHSQPLRSTTSSSSPAAAGGDAIFGAGVCSWQFGAVSGFYESLKVDSPTFRKLEVEWNGPSGPSRLLRRATASRKTTALQAQCSTFTWVASPRVARLHARFVFATARLELTCELL